VNKTLITVSGPTAIGKTKFAIDLAKFLNCEIISSDSRQFYKELSIGTAVPSKNELDAVKHHCIQHKSIQEIYTIKDFEQEALKIINNLFKKNKYVIMVGGSGLYMDAVVHGLDDLPKIDDEIRKTLNIKFKKFGIEYLKKELKKLDPKYFIKVDKNNPRRLIRALEVCLSSKKPYSSFIVGKKNNHSFNIFHIGLKLDRNELYDRINSRVDQMIEKGLINEVKGLINFKNLNPLNTVGYKELFLFLDNKKTLEESTKEIKKNTRRFAKRQMTWLRKKDILWISNTVKVEKIKNYLDLK
jgi:tRNA dimethylallyltransferase